MSGTARSFPPQCADGPYRCTADCLSRTGAGVRLLPQIALVLGFVLHSMGLLGTSAFECIFAVAMGSMFAVVLQRLGAPRLWSALGGLAVVGAALMLSLLVPEAELAPYLAIVLINGLVAYVFGKSIVTGGTPLIVQLISAMAAGPECSGAFRRYVDGQSWSWLVLVAATGLCGATAMVSSSLRDEARRADRRVGWRADRLVHCLSLLCAIPLWSSGELGRHPPRHGPARDLGGSEDLRMRKEDDLLCFSESDLFSWGDLRRMSRGFAAKPRQQSSFATCSMIATRSWWGSPRHF